MIPRQFPIRAAIAAALAMLALAATPAVAQNVVPPPAIAPLVAPAIPVETPYQALAEDAAVYARAYGVSRDEALFRLRAQQDSVAATDRIQALYRDRLAGIAIEHQPDYRIVVLLTGTDPVPDEMVPTGGRSVPIVFHTGALATRDQVVTAIEQHQAEIRALLPHPPQMGADPRTGMLAVMVDGTDAGMFAPGALQARVAAIAGVPVEIRVLGRDTIMAAPAPATMPATLDVGGGSRVVGVNPDDGRRYACTTGFVVTDGTRTGVITAAHCPDSLSFVDRARHETPLEFVGQWGWGYQDVQIHVSPTPLKPLFHPDAAKAEARPLVTWRNRTSTRAGEIVCHRGETTGYSCAPVEMVDFAPAGDLCGGPCPPTWVTVRGKGGDSGGPVFSGTIAFGILKGGSYRADGTCLFYYYMSTDYLPPGWALLHGLPPAPPPLPPPVPAIPALPAATNTVPVP